MEPTVDIELQGPGHKPSAARMVDPAYNLRHSRQIPARGGDVAGITTA
jgi:hypothetical protein